MNRQKRPRDLKIFFVSMHINLMTCQHHPNVFINNSLLLRLILRIRLLWMYHNIILQTDKGNRRSTKWISKHFGGMKIEPTVPVLSIGAYRFLSSSSCMYHVFYCALLFDECSFQITVTSLRPISRGGLFFFHYVVRKFHFLINWNENLSTYQFIHLSIHQFINSSIQQFINSF